MRSNAIKIIMIELHIFYSAAKSQKAITKRNHKGKRKI